MTRPRRYLLRMLLFVIVVAAAAAFLYEPLKRAFLASAPINGLILGVLLLGIIYIFRQVLKLLPEVNWLEAYRGDREVLSQTAEPRLLSSMARMLGERRGRLSLSTMTMRSLLDGIASRLDEARELSRYTIGLLIFLGLLGTFWGLLQTVSSVGNVIGGLSVEGGGDVSSVFANLQQGLQAPLAGMGTAFSSSLFGLSGSLILGFLDLQAGQAQNRFFNELEEWLSGQTRLGSGTLGLEGEHSVPVYVQALLEQTAESLETLQRTIARGEENRNATQSHLLDLGEKISALTDQMRSDQGLMQRVVETQSELKPILARLAETSGRHDGGGLDEATRTHIRNLDRYVARLMEDVSSGREEILQRVRTDIKLLARTIASATEEAGR
jgi:hypothetical protein